MIDGALASLATVGLILAVRVYVTLAGPMTARLESILTQVTAHMCGESTSNTETTDCTWPESASIRRCLLSWYASSRRRLPWRGDAPPWNTDKTLLRQQAAVSAAGSAATRARCLGANGFAKRLKTGRVEIDIEDVPMCATNLVDSKVATPVAEGVGSHLTSPVEGAFPKTAYGVWVSEVMSQQTQVERVVEYWVRWMLRFPTVAELASADADAVRVSWAGLGYYGRARRLHEGAKYLVEHHGGDLPRDLDALQSIPGVGPYTAGAILSIAFGRRAAVVDGNVVRVFSRLKALPGSASSLSRQCWSLAHALVDPDEPGSFNQALMELGATVCTPLAPACDRCPVRSSCRAFALVSTGQGQAVTTFPEKSPKKSRRLRSLAVALVVDAEHRALLVRRPPSGLLAGQWEFPCVKLADDDGGRSDDEVGERLRTFLEDVIAGLPTLQFAKLGIPPVLHVFSHEEHVSHLYQAVVAEACHCGPSAAHGREARWMTAADARVEGVTSGVLKIFRAYGSITSRAGRDA